MSRVRFGSRSALIAVSLAAAIVISLAVALVVHFAGAGHGVGVLAGPGRASDSALTAGLKTHLSRLTSPEMEGRRSGSAGFRRASEYAADFFSSAGLEAAWTGADGKGTFFQPVPSPQAEVPDCRNVVALLRGSDPTLRSEFVTLGAHLDHLGVAGGVVYPGANDDASGCAAVLEAARVLAAAPPKRSVLFVLFTGEETGFWSGSGEFVKHPPVPLDKVVMNVNVEQIGSRHRTFPGIWAFGPMSLKAPFDAAAARGPDYQTRYQGINPYPLEITGTDTEVFALYQLPAILLGSGGFKEHHTPQDTIELIDFEQMTKATAFIIDYVRELATR